MEGDDFMDVLLDKINQGLIRITYARNEIKFCESILKEKEIRDKLYENDDFSDTFYSDNHNTLDNLYYINLRMAITDLYTLVANSESNSFVKINKTICDLPIYKDRVSDYDQLLEYLSKFNKIIDSFDSLIKSIITIRNVYVAHTDGINRRTRFKDVSINLFDLRDLMKELFAYYFNMQSFIENTYNGDMNSLFTSDYINEGSNNTFEKMSRFYKKDRRR